MSEWPEGALYHSPLGLFTFQEWGIAEAYLRGQAVPIWDTGTGKSHLAMRVSTLLVEDDSSYVTLLVCEKGKVGEWVEDYLKFTTLTVGKHHGPTRMKRLEKSGMPQVLVTTYETAKADLATVWREPNKRGLSVKDGPLLPLLRDRKVLVVYDESSKLRNRSSGNYKAQEYFLKQMRKMDPSLRVLGLTATPLESEWEDAFNQGRLIKPEAFPSITDFGKYFTYGRDGFNRPMYRKDRMHEFAAMWQTIMMRKRKTDPDVIAEFPKVTEESRHFDLDPDHRKLYDLVAGLAWDEHDEPVEIPGLWTVLRQVAGHPQSLIHSARHGGSALSQMLLEELGEEYLRGIRCSKEDGLIEYLSPIVKGQGAKAVVFTFFGQSILPVLAQSLRDKDFLVFTNHGGMSESQQTLSRRTFREHPKPCVYLTSDAGSKGINLPEATYVCVEARTPVLTPDLRWVEVGTMKEGDGIVGCEEDVREGKGRERSRRWKVGSVVRNQIEPRHCLRVTLSNGDSLLVTPEHRMIARNGKGVRDWVRADQLKVGWRLLKYLNTWEQASSFDDGWLSGLFDGEGWFIKSGRCTTLAVAQNEGHVLERIRDLVSDAGFAIREHHYEQHGRIHRFHVTGGRAEQTRFLGTYQPVRLVPKWREVIEQFIISAVDTPRVISVEDAGIRDVAVIETTTKTFIGSGYMHHNCEYESALTYANRTQRINRINRIDSLALTSTCMTFIANGTVEVKVAEGVIKRNEYSDILLGDDDAGENFMTAADRRMALRIDDLKRPKKGRAA